MRGHVRYTGPSDSGTDIVAVQPWLYGTVWSPKKYQQKGKRILVTVELVLVGLTMKVFQ